MITAFVDMMGLLVVVPLIPFYADSMGGHGLVVGLLMSSFAVAQLLSAPLWGRVSDRFGRRPALLIGLSAAAVAYVIFAFANTLWLLFLSRLVQGAGGGTVGVLNAYVADVTEPDQRAKSLGWLSAATSAGVALGPLIGSAASHWGPHAPGLLAAALCVLNIGFARIFLPESHTTRAAGNPPERSLDAVLGVLTRTTDPATRLIWVYAVAMGAFMGSQSVLALFLKHRHAFTETTIGGFYTYIGVIAVLARAVLLGPAVDRLGETRLSRVGTVLLALGLIGLPLTFNLPTLAVAAALVPLGTAFTFPCVTALLSRLVDPGQRGLYMGVQQTFGGVGRVIGPALIGAMYQFMPTLIAFWSAAALVLGTLYLRAGAHDAPSAVGSAAARAPTP